MIKVYIDWNVMSGMKSNYFPEFSKLIKRDKFLLVYSSSHIGDIFASYNESFEQQNVIQQDLDFISELTSDNCIVSCGDKITIDLYDPSELMNDRIRESPIFKDMSIDTLLKSIDLAGNLSNLLSSYFNLLKNLPLDIAFKQAYNNTESAEILKNVFPGLENNLTMEGFFNAFSQMNKDLNEKESYKDIREIIQKVGVSSGHFNETKNPFDVIDKAYQKLNIDGFEFRNHFDNSKSVPNWFNEIVNQYLKLDIHGFKADKVKVSEKGKNTFRNTSEDAFHSGFASRCDFYITSDDKNYKKTKAVFEKLQIRTKVLKPNEFIEYFGDDYEKDKFDNHFDLIVQTISTGEFFNLNYSSGENFGFVHYSDKFFFNFYNKILIPKNKSEGLQFVLSKDHSSDSFYILAIKELECLLTIMVNKFGADYYGKSLYQSGEIEGDNWAGRRWDVGDFSFRIARLNGWFQFYFYIIK